MLCPVKMYVNGALQLILRLLFLSMYMYFVFEIWKQPEIVHRQTWALWLVRCQLYTLQKENENAACCACRNSRIFKTLSNQTSRFICMCVRMWDNIKAQICLPRVSSKITINSDTPSATATTLVFISMSRSYTFR